MWDTMSPTKGNRNLYSSGINGNCPTVALYQPGSFSDNCAFNGLWANHTQGANFCMGDGSVRTIAYTTGTQPLAASSVIEALASRSGNDPVPLD
jgi:prepilin-type processing-associated H-X9-DG protein